MRNDCPLCKGTGSVVAVVDGVRKSVECSCLHAISEKARLLKAHIPEQYHVAFGQKDFDPVFVKANKPCLVAVNAYLSNLEENIASGKGLWFTSSPGLGKSTIICEILKQALRAGLTAHFDRASHLLSTMFDAIKDQGAADYLDGIKTVNIIAIEEIEKVYLLNDSAFGNITFYEFLSDLYDLKKPILLSSNESKKKVLAKYPDWLGDRLATIPEIMFCASGTLSYRKKG
jgi:DNA replication protein DnaC